LSDLPLLPVIAPLPQIDSSTLPQSSIGSVALTPQQQADANLASNTYLGTTLPTSTTSNSTPITQAASSSTNLSPTIFGAASNAAKNFFSFSSLNLEDGVFIILGLLLIAAGIFAFKTTQTIIQRGSDLAAKGSEIAAKAAA